MSLPASGAEQCAELRGLGISYHGSLGNFIVENVN